MLITKDMLVSWGACWSDREIDNHLGERSGMTPREVAEDETIPLSDRLWVMCGAVGHADDSGALVGALIGFKVTSAWPTSGLWRHLDPAPHGGRAYGMGIAECEAVRRRVIVRALELLGPLADAPPSTAWAGL